MIEKIKELRVEIDGLAQLTKSLKPIQECSCGVCSSINSKQIEQALDNLYLAKAWLGKMYVELGGTPYKSGYKTKEDIEPTTDTAKAGVLGNYHLGNVMFFKSEDITHIEKVDWLRTEIEKLVEKLIDLELENRVFHNSIYQFLCTAKIFLGFELERIKSE